VLLLEASSSVGGKIATDRDSGYLLEAGPNSLRVDSEDINTMLAELGLADRVLEASPNAQKRFILRGGRWVQVPGSPLGAITTSLFSLAGKLRILAEPFIARGKSEDESIESFITRRLGGEVFRYAADPFVTGIYAGDTSKLSMRHTFPSMWKAERDSGSLIRGVMASKKSKGRMKTKIISFPNGLGELTTSLRSHLGPIVRTSDSAIKISRDASGYRISTPTETLTAPRVILAAPAIHTAEQIAALSPQTSGVLSGIDYPPIGVVYLGFRADQFSSPIEGFGGLIPSIENRKILGVIYSSSNFPKRAPDGHVLLTVLVGGARHPDVADWSEEHAIEVARGEIDDLLPHVGAPQFQRARIWKRAIPQYPVGYQRVVDEIDRFEREHPGLYCVGNYRGGISMTSCMRSATQLVRRIVQN
jgi:oxygen-dependent protoporphyrinogen oxidase